MGSYVHLGPDDQVLLKRATGKYVQNGPWSGQLHPFHEQTWRKAVLLDPLEYAIIEDIITSYQRVEVGPKLLFLGAYDEIDKRVAKLVLQKHQYVRLINKGTGEERVLTGPGTIVPLVTEVHDGVHEAVFVNTGTAVVVRNKLTGAQELVTSCTLPSGVWFPKPAEELIDVRELIQVLPHEALVVRDVDGVTTVYSGREAQPAGSGGCGSGAGVGGVAFFLPPYSKIVRMFWSQYAAVSNTVSNNTRRLHVEPPKPLVDGELPLEDPHPIILEGHGQEHDTHQMHMGRRLVSSEQIYVYDEAKESRRLESIYVDQVSTTVSSAPKRAITAIDLRSQKSWYSFEVRTNDNVRLLLQGTIFWRIKDVRQMLKMTSDPEGDVWSKSRSTLIGAVGVTRLDDFMKNFNDIVLAAFDAQKNSSFWQDRGIEMISIELNNYQPIDEYTANTLQSIIRQTVKRINDLQKQRSENDVLREKLDADIKLEANTTRLIEQQAKNFQISAESAGERDGGKSAASVGSFLDNLGSTLTNSTERLQMYRQHLLLSSAQKDSEHLTTGTANLYMSPKDMELRLQMPAETAEL